MELKAAGYQSPGKPGEHGFEDRESYQLSLDLVSFAYEIARGLPPEEAEDMSPHLRRASKGVSEYLAQGLSWQGAPESVRFFRVAHGELSKLLTHFIHARVLGYLPEESFAQVYEAVHRLEVLLIGMVTAGRSQHAGQGQPVFRPGFTTPKPAGTTTGGAEFDEYDWQEFLDDME